MMLQVDEERPKMENFGDLSDDFKAAREIKLAAAKAPKVLVNNVNILIENFVTEIQELANTENQVMGIQLYLTYEERMEDIKDWLFKEHNKLCHEAAMKDPTNHKGHCNAQAQDAAAMNHEPRF